MKNYKKFASNILIFFLLSFSNVLSEVINKIEITGNDRISDETIILFTETDLGENIFDNDINQILKNLYNSNFFENVSLKFENNTLEINVVESPIVSEIKISGIKTKKITEVIKKSLITKSRGSFNEVLIKSDKTNIENNLKSIGYYFAKVEPFVEFLENNLVIVDFKIDLGEKAKIKKISFIGEKIFKNNKLKSVIVSEEYKFWKFISGKKFLQEDLIKLDQRLLKNFYLNEGYYNVEINTSFAKLINDNEFELIFNINPKNKIFFGDMNLILPDDFNDENYVELKELLVELKDEPYSIYSLEKILDEIDLITTIEEFKTSTAYAEQNIVSNKLNIDFIVKETENFYVERINIFGNNITRENVIRNQLEVDEGDPFNEILAKKSENNLKSLGFFKDVKTEIIDGKTQNSKIINYKFQEKPTGEIQAGAGVGTDGSSFTLGVKENNYLGRGIGLDSSLTVSGESLKGRLRVTNPNLNNSDKAVFLDVRAEETDKLKKFGYKTNKTGFGIGTNFEYLRDFNLGISTSAFSEKITTNSTASARQKKQAGSYIDTFAKINLFYDKRNQKFKTSDGFFTNYSINAPIISDTNTLTNKLDYKTFHELYQNNITTFSLSFSSANSLSDDNVKLSERLFIPSNKLRGFENGKVGPKDGNDFIGANYTATVNAQSTIPKIFENLENLDASIFIDAGTLWGVDYDSSLDDGAKLRSSFGVGVDWFTVVGPLNFSLTEVITKENNDITETFKFNLGTTF